MTSSVGSMSKGLLLIGVYTLGFVIPFLLLGCFTGAMLNGFKKHKGIVKYTVKLGGLLMLLMGILMITGFTNSINSYLSGAGVPENMVDVEENIVEEDVKEDIVIDNVPKAPDFTLMDQNGNYHTLSEYQGKVVFLNFWASWCGPCQSEMADIQEIYEEYGFNENDVVILGVANPSTQQYRNQDISTIELGRFIKSRNLTYPTVMDITSEVFSQYGITSLPTTFMINKNGEVFGSILGALSKDMMVKMVGQLVMILNIQIMNCKI